MNNKRGSGWPVSKLLAIVLAVFLLVIIIIGIGPKGLIPLKERLGGMMDNILILFGVGGGRGSEECYTDYAAPQIQGIDSNFILTKCKDNCSVFLSDSIEYGQNFSYVRVGKNKYEFRVLDKDNSRVLSPLEIEINSEVAKEREIYHTIREAIYSGLGDTEGSNNPDYSKDLGEEVKDLFRNWSSSLYVVVGDDKIYRRVILDEHFNNLWDNSNFDLRGNEIYLDNQRTNFYLSGDSFDERRIINYRRYFGRIDKLMPDVPEVGFIYDNKINFDRDNFYEFVNFDDKEIAYLLSNNYFLNLSEDTFHQKTEPQNYIWYLGNFEEGFNVLNWNDENALREIQKSIGRKDLVSYRIGEGHNLDKTGEWRVVRNYSSLGNLIYSIQSDSLKGVEYRLFLDSQSIGYRDGNYYVRVAEINKDNGKIETQLKVSYSVDNSLGIKNIGPLVKDYSLNLDVVRLERNFENFDGDNLRKFILEKIKSSELIEKEKQKTLNDLNQIFDNSRIDLGGQYYDLNLAVDFERPSFFVKIGEVRYAVSHNGNYLYLLKEDPNGNWIESSNMQKIALGDKEFQDLQKLNYIHRYLQSCFGSI